MGRLKNLIGNQVCPAGFGWMVVSKKGRKKSCHRTKKQAENAQLKLNRANVFVRKVKRGGKQVFLR